jgi:sulfide dehydrogenase [flavocytochrome c] flavoprotein subunit
MQGWTKLYGYGTANSMIEWVKGDATDFGIAKVDAGAGSVTTKFGDTHKGDVLNVIPAQKAGKIAFAAGLTEGDWCPVDKGTFESKKAPGVHVIGDASVAATMPKSGYSANSQAKVCAAAVVAMLRGQQPGTPSYVNTCYSIVGHDYGISVAAVYRLGSDDKGAQVIAGVKGAGGLTPSDASPEHLRREMQYAHSWFNNITKDVFG